MMFKREPQPYRHVRILPSVCDREKEEGERGNIDDTVAPIEQAKQRQLTIPASEAYKTRLQNKETVDTLHLVDALPNQSYRDRLRNFGKKVVDSFKPINN